MSSSYRPIWSRILRSRVISPVCGALSAAAVFVLVGGSCVLTAQTSSSAQYQVVTDPDSSASTSSSGEAALASKDNGRPAVPAYGYPQRTGLVSHIAAVFGGGLTTPADKDQHDLTYGWNVDFGGGYKFTKNFALLGEFQFDGSKIPAKVLQQIGEPGGNVHIWSLTANPVWNIKTSGSYGAYLTGGGGYYHKTTSFTQPAVTTSYYCDYFSCYPYQYLSNVVVSQFSSDQGGMDIGGGLTLGKFSGGKFFAEARYNWIDTPGHATRIIPATFGFRW